MTNQVAICPKRSCGAAVDLTNSYAETEGTLQHVEDADGNVSHLLHLTARGRDITISGPKLIGGK